MKKFIVFAALIVLGISPIYALADGGGGADPGGEPFATLAFHAEATIVPYDQEHPIEAALGVAVVTIDSTVHRVGITGATSGDHFWVQFSDSFDLNGTVDTGSYDYGTPIIACDVMGNWSHTSANSSSLFTLPAGSYTAHVNSDLLDKTYPTINFAHQTSTSGFTIQ